MILRIGFLVVCLLFAFPVHADPAPADSAPAPADEYLKPSWPDLLRTMVRFNALDLSDDTLLDGYAAVTECDLYQFFYKDDFKWNEVRKTIRKSVQMNMATFPVHYRVSTVLRLDRYDFDNKLYRFTAETAVHGVNAFKIYEVVGSICGDDAVRHMPRSFHAVSDAPINLPGLPLSPMDAEALLRQMNADKNTDHAIYAGFDMTVTYIDRMRKLAITPGVNDRKSSYVQSSIGDPQKVRFDVRLDSVNFYEDKAMTKPVYSYKP